MVIRHIFFLFFLFLTLLFLKAGYWSRGRGFSPDILLTFSRSLPFSVCVCGLGGAVWARSFRHMHGGPFLTAARPPSQTNGESITLKPPAQSQLTVA